MDTFFYDYFDKIKSHLDLVNQSELENFANIIIETQNNKNKVIVVGNGGSSAISSHISIDLTNAAKIRAVSFNDPAVITCFSNDFGYENWVKKALQYYADRGDLLILISSSGQSKNMIVGADYAKNIGINVATLSGFSPNNPLREKGDVNLWVGSTEYNIVEMVHNIWLLSVVDYIIDLNDRRGK